MRALLVARGYAAVEFTQYHLIYYWKRTFPRHFELVPVSGADHFFVKIAFVTRSALALSRLRGVFLHAG